MVRSSILFILPYLLLSYSLPGIIFGFTPTGINSFLQGLLPAFESSIKSLVIPELTIPVVQQKGMATDLKFEQIKATSIYIDTGNSGLSFTSNNQILFTIPELIANFKFAWTVQSHTTHEAVQKGAGKVSINNAHLNVVITVGTSSENAFSLKKSEFKIEKFEVNFDEPSGVYNWVLEAVNRKLKNSIEQAVTKEMNYFIKTILQGTKTYNFNELIEVNLGLVSGPVIDERHLELLLNGTGKVKGKDYSIDDIKNEVELKYSSHKDFGVFISEYSLNTLMLAQHKLKPISFSSLDFGLNITTDVLEPVFEGINKEFGPDNDVKIECQASEHPKIKLAEDLINGNFQFLCTLSTETQQPVQLNLGFIGKISLKMVRDEIKANIEDCKLDSISAINSNLKREVNIAGIKNLINLSLSLWKGLISQIVFEQGIQIPEFFKTFTKDSFVEIEKGYLRIEGNTFFPFSSN